MTDQRQHWINFICSKNHAGRYLYGSGHSAFGQGSDIDEFQVESFLERLSAVKADARYVALLYYLAQPPVKEFFSNHLPDLLRSLSHVRIGHEELSRRGIRGKVSWSATSRARLSGKADAGAFIVNLAHKSPEVPENQLLKLFVLDVFGALSEAIQILGSGALLRDFEEIRTHTKQALRSPYISEIHTPRTASALMHSRAHRNRNWRYGELSRLQAQMEAVVRQNRWEAIVQLLQNGWLAPVDDDDILELYVLVMLLDVLVNELGFDEPYQYGLIRKGRKEVAKFLRQSDSVRADIYFDQTPRTVFGIKSEYTSVLADYDGVTGYEHRPDILIRFIFPDDSERRVVLEVKDSEDERYTRDSVYKVLAYLRDFQAIWEEEPSQTPKAILVFPENIKPKAGIHAVGRDLVLTSAGDRSRLVSCLKAALANIPKGTI